MEAVQEDLHYWKHRALNVETVLKELMESLAQSQEENRILKEKYPPPLSLILFFPLG